MRVVCNMQSLAVDLGGRGGGGGGGDGVRLSFIQGSKCDNDTIMTMKKQ